MKFRPQFSLQTLFILVALAAFICSAFLAWRQSALNWIRQRHEFIQASDVFTSALPPLDPHIIHYDDAYIHEAPWQLRVCGEASFGWIGVPSSKVEQASKLFPEAHIQDRSAP